MGGWFVPAGLCEDRGAVKLQDYLDKEKTELKESLFVAFGGVWEVVLGFLWLLIFLAMVPAFPSGQQVPCAPVPDVGRCGEVPVLENIVYL